MKIIEVRPSLRFKGGWVSFEQHGVQPVFQDREHALDYAKDRFGGFPEGEIHVYDDAGENIVEKIPIDGGTGYGNPHLK